jgi:hypothetical protein
LVFGWVGGGGGGGGFVFWGGGGRGRGAAEWVRVGAVQVGATVGWVRVGLGALPVRLATAIDSRQGRSCLQRAARALAFG